jgi:hypothetical protein
MVILFRWSRGSIGDSRINVADDIEVEHQARPFFVTVAEELQNTIDHRGIPSNGVEPAPNHGAGLET